MQSRQVYTMTTTPEAIEREISKYLTVGFDTDIDQDENDWRRFVARLTGEDIPLLVQMCVAHINKVGRADPDDRWLEMLISCIRQTAHKDPDIWLREAEQYCWTKYRSIFLESCTEVFADDVVDWLIEFVHQAELSTYERWLVACAYSEIAIERCLYGLDHLLARLPYTDRHPTVDMNLREFVEGLRASLAKRLEEP